MKAIRYTVRGLSPGLLTNPATMELLEQLRTKTPVPSKKDITLLDDAKMKIYRSEPEPAKPGKMGIPMQNIMSCLVLAGQNVKSGKKNLSTAKSTKIFEFLDFPQDFCPFLGCDEKTGDVPWTPFPVKGTMHNGASEVAVCINRPRIKNWELQFLVKFDDKRGIDIKTVHALVEMAGRQIGLGDWRPQKRGRFGRFVTTKIEVLAIDQKEEKAEVHEYTLQSKDIPAELLALAEA